MSAEELELLARWVELNQGVLVGYWDGHIEWTNRRAGQPLETAGDNT